MNIKSDLAINDIVDKAIDVDNIFDNILYPEKKCTFKVICDHSIINPRLYFTNGIKTKELTFLNQLIKDILDLDGKTINNVSQEEMNKVFPYVQRHSNDPIFHLTKRNKEILSKYLRKHSIPIKNIFLYMHHINNNGTLVFGDKYKLFRIVTIYKESEIIICLIDPYHLAAEKNYRKDYLKYSSCNICFSCLKN